MSIHLSIKAEDAEVEDLLSFVRTRFSALPPDEHVYIMERAILWLRAIDPYAFKIDPRCPNQVSLDLRDISGDSALPPDKPVPYPQSS
jgi:hypothetical protein